jgi:DNA-binding transcriptional ArsR family regulator
LVRRNSVHKDALQGFFQSFDPRTRGKILKAAERYDNLTKSKGKRNGALGYTGLKVLKALLEFIDYKSGRLEPSYLALCKKACLSVSAVSAALKRLVKHGFLELQRRYEETGYTDGGPTVRQITNAYRISLPALAAKTLRSVLPAPFSDDERERRRALYDERERMIRQLPEWQQPVVRANVSDPQLTDVLNSLARAVYAADNPHVQL